MKVISFAVLVVGFFILGLSTIFFSSFCFLGQHKLAVIDSTSTLSFSFINFLVPGFLRALKSACYASVLALCQQILTSFVSDSYLLCPFYIVERHMVSC